MEKLNVAAIAKVTLNQREQIVLMRPYHKGIVLHTLYFASEVREVAEYGKIENMTLQKPEVELAEQFITQLTAGFEPEQYKDEYQDRVLALVETKRAGQVVAGQPQKPKLAPVIDLMEALKKSIAERGAPPLLLLPLWSNPPRRKGRNQPQLQKASPRAAAKPVKFDSRTTKSAPLETITVFLKASSFRRPTGAPHLARFSRDVGYHGALLLTLVSTDALTVDVGRPHLDLVKGQSPAV